MSNTWFFDKCLNWKGLCIEANEELAKSLRKRRSCTVVSDCVSAERVDLHFNVPDHRHELGYISEDNAAHVFHKVGGGSLDMKTELRTCLPLNEIFERHGVPSRVNYMDLDIEGYELQALAGLDLTEKYHVDVISIENSYHDRHYEAPLYAQGYSKVGIVGSDDMWHRQTPFGKPLIKPVHFIPESTAYQSLSEKNRKCCQDPDKCPHFNP